MGKAGKQLDTARAARNRARRRFDSRLVLARQDLAPGAIAGRAASDLKRKAMDAFDEAVDVADGNRAIVAGTIAALAIWLFRKPIASRIGELLGERRKLEDSEDE